METIKKATQFDQYIQYKALEFKFQGQNVPENITETLIQDSEKLPVKNVCAKLHVDLSNLLDQTILNLNMSKRKFIELALIDAIEKAENIMGDVDMTEYFEDNSNGEEK